MEVDEFLDTPVERYSSGMRVRLVFAVAANLTPEVLLIDEVLAVGDAEFQKKCLGKMDDVAQAGRTIVFVSHNMGAISRICKRAVWLDHGQIKKIGATGVVVQAYMANGTAGQASVEFDVDPKADGQLVSLEVLNHYGEQSSRILANETFTVRLRYRLHETIKQYRVGIFVRQGDGLDVYASSSTDVDGSLWDSVAGEYIADLRIPMGLLSSGRYVLSCFLNQPPLRRLDHRHNALAFDVHGSSRAIDEGNNWPGVIGLPLPCQHRYAA